MAHLLKNAPAPRSFWMLAVSASVVLVAVLVSTGVSWPAGAAVVLFTAAAPFLAAVDWRERRLPDVITLPLVGVCFIALGVAAAITDQWGRLGNAVGCSLGVAAFFFVLFIIAPSQLGFGDVKLMLSVGLVLGWHGPLITLVGAALGLLIGLIFGLVLILLKRAGRRSQVALGPHLIAGTLVLAFLVY